MTAFLIFLGVWTLVALVISLLLGSALGRRRPSIDSLGSRGGTRAEGERPGGEASGTPSAAPRRDVPRRWRMVLELVAAEGCRFNTEGKPCHELPDLDRDLGWCTPCIAYDALNQTPSSPVSSPGFEVAPSTASRDGESAVEGASNVP